MIKAGHIGVYCNKGDHTPWGVSWEGVKRGFLGDRLGLGDWGKGWEAQSRSGLEAVRTWDNCVVEHFNNFYLGRCERNRVGLEL